MGSDYLDWVVVELENLGWVNVKLTNLSCTVNRMGLNRCTLK